MNDTTDKYIIGYDPCNELSKITVMKVTDDVIEVIKEKPRKAELIMQEFKVLLNRFVKLNK